MTIAVLPYIGAITDALSIANALTPLLARHAMTGKPPTDDEVNAALQRKDDALDALDALIRQREAAELTSPGEAVGRRL
jgi:hypothetical protein